MEPKRGRGRLKVGIGGRGRGREGGEVLKLAEWFLLVLTGHFHNVIEQ